MESRVESLVDDLWINNNDDEYYRYSPPYGSSKPSEYRMYGGMKVQQPKEPKDKYNFIYLIMVMSGVGVLTPWNMFITAKPYFIDYKFVDSVEYVTQFLTYIGIASQLPNMIINWMNVFINTEKYSPTLRTIYSLVVQIAVFCITILLANINTSHMVGTFFWITMATVVLVNTCSGIYQNSIFSMAARLPAKYIGAVVLGTNISGIFVALVSLISLQITDDLQLAATNYFSIAVIVLIVCFHLQRFLNGGKFYKYYDAKHNFHKPKRAGNVTAVWNEFKRICFPSLFNIFMTFFVTLSIFPIIHSDIRAIDGDNNIFGNNFTLITCFLTFNLCAMLGSLTTLWIRIPSKYLVWPIVSRLIFIPLFLFCNYKPDGFVRTLPVLIDNDLIYWTLALLMSFSSGFLSSLAMMSVHEHCLDFHIAGSLGAATLVTGVTCGIFSTFIYPRLL